MPEKMFKDISNLAPEEVLFTYIFYLEPWQPLCSAEQTHLCNFGKVHHEKQFCGIVSNLDTWPRRFRLKTGFI